MSAHEGAPASGLTAEAASMVETYFSRVHGALLVNAAGECEEAVDELRAHVIEMLRADGGAVADVTRVLDELGTPEAVAAEYADADPETIARRRVDLDTVRLHGKVLGVPYDLRVPNSDRIASRWWNPLDSRVFVPRVFGLGWDINFGALAVLTHLVRPDDEDEPFAAVPQGAVWASLAVPALLSLTFVVLVTMRWSGLPDSLPVHWNIAGRADNFWGRDAAIGFLALMSLLPTVFAVSTHVRRGPALNRVAASVFATLLSTVALAVLWETLAYVDGASTGRVIPVGVALCLVLPFVMLVTLSRLGRAAEQRRDIGAAQKKGSV